MKFPIFQLEDFLARYEFDVPYMLCGSDAESLTLEELLAMAGENEKKLWDRLPLSYTHVPGMPELRSAISSLYRGTEADDILCFAGAQEGIFCTMQALLQAGDHAIVWTPCYQSLADAPVLAGAEVSRLPLEKQSWQPDPDQLSRAIRSNTRCILLNTPHNPTGSVIDAERMEAILRIADRKGIWVFSDEVYRGLTPAGNFLEAPSAAESYPRGISLGVMSKSFGLAGLRIGWIACRDASMLKKIKEVKYYTSICNSAPSEVLSLIALRERRKILERNSAIVRNNFLLVDQWIRSMPHLFSWVPPQGGCTGLVEFHGEESVDALIERLVKQGILLLPGSVYDMHFPCFRIGFGKASFAAGFKRLVDQFPL